MGREIVAANIDESLKTAIVDAAQSIEGKRLATTALLERIGRDLESQIKLLKAEHGGNLPACDLQIRMIPRQ
jgi:hypothetical protein